jgi:cell division protein FtsB
MQAAWSELGGSILSLGLGLLMLTLIILLLANFVGQVIQNARLEDQRIALEAEVAALEARNATRAGAIAFAESDVSVELLARERLGFARDGDTVLLPQLPPVAPAPAAPAPAPDPPPAEAPAPNWMRWWRAFFP